MPNNDTPKSPIELQYEREYRRATQALRRQKKYGYTIPEEVLPIKPSKMKKVTPEDVANLERLTPKFIREHSYYIDTSTGEAVYGLDVVKSHHKAKPSKATIKNTNKRKRKSSKSTTKKPKTVSPKYKDKIPPKEVNLNTQIINDITALLDTFQPPAYWRDSMRARKYGIHATLSLLWEEVLNIEGEYQVAYRLEQHAEELRKVTNRLLYESGNDYTEQPDMGRFGELVFGKPFTQAESDYYSDYAYQASMQAMGHF